MSLNILKSIGTAFSNEKEQDRAMGYLLHALSTYDKEVKQHLSGLLEISDRAVRRNEVIASMHDTFTPASKDGAWLNQYLDGSRDIEGLSGMEILHKIEQTLMEYDRVCERRDAIPIKTNGLFLLYWSRYLTRYFHIVISHEEDLKRLLKQSYRYRNTSKEWVIASVQLQPLYRDFLTQHRSFIAQLNGEETIVEEKVEVEVAEEPHADLSESIFALLSTDITCELGEDGLETLVQNDSQQITLKELKRRLFFIAKWNGVDWTNRERVGNLFQLHETDMKILFDQNRENDSILALHHFNVEIYHQYARKIMLEIEGKI